MRVLPARVLHPAADVAKALSAASRNPREEMRRKGVRLAGGERGQSESESESEKERAREREQGREREKDFLGEIGPTTT